MANRPVYAVGKGYSLCQVHQVEFEFHRGLSKVQKQRSSASLRDAFIRNHPDLRVLEVSRYSEDSLGVKLSAFNLSVTTKDGRKLAVECAFQGGKIMREYGQLADLYDKTPAEAKADPRRTNGTLIGFVFDGENFELNPKTAFYNWVYIRALAEHPELGDVLMEYDAFTDIAFNPQKAVNCQAEACAYYVALRRRGLLEEALESKEKFIELLYHSKPRKALDITQKRMSGVGAADGGKLGKIADVNTQVSGSVAAEKKEEVPGVVLNVGDEITHPKFGKGVITEISKETDAEILTVCFGADTKKISKEWLIMAMNRSKNK